MLLLVMYVRNNKRVRDKNRVSEPIYEFSLQLDALDSKGVEVVKSICVYVCGAFLTDIWLVFRQQIRRVILQSCFFPTLHRNPMISFGFFSRSFRTDEEEWYARLLYTWNL